MNGFLKFLVSSKYQLSLIVVAIISVAWFKKMVEASIAVDALVKITIAYFSARIVEPIVEYVTKKKGE